MARGRRLVSRWVQQGAWPLPEAAAVVRGYVRDGGRLYEAAEYDVYIVLASGECPHGQPRWQDRRLREKVMNDAIRQRLEARGKVSGPRKAEDAATAKAYPTLWAYLAETEGLDGGQRETASLFVFASDGELKVCLHDRETDEKLWRSAATLDGLWKALEKALAGSGADWRPNRPYDKRKGGR